MKYNYQIVKIISIFIFAGLSATDIGSDTAVTRFNTQQQVNNGDRIAGFAGLNAGFFLTSAAVTATFDSVFPVSGNIALKGGTLILNTDLILENVATVTSLGNITGRNHVFELSSSVSCLPSVSTTNTCYNFSNVVLTLDDDICLQTCLNFQGNSTINGRGYILTMQPNSTIKVDVNSTLLLKDIIIQNIDGTQIMNVDDSGTILLDNVTWIQDGNFTFTQGKFNVLADFHVIGDGFNFTYQSSQMNTIQQNGRFILDHGVTFSYDTVSNVLLQLSDPTAQIILQGGTIASSASGLQLTGGHLVIDRQSFVSVVSPGTISFGGGFNPVNNLNVQWFPAATLEALQGCVVYNEA